MTPVSLGEHSKIAVAPEERERLQTFYRDVLGCKVIAKSKGADLIPLGPSFYIGVNDRLPWAIPTVKKQFGWSFARTIPKH